MNVSLYYNQDYFCKLTMNEQTLTDVHISQPIKMNRVAISTNIRFDFLLHRKQSLCQSIVLYSEIGLKMR